MLTTEKKKERKKKQKKTHFSYLVNYEEKLSSDFFYFFFQTAIEKFPFQIRKVFIMVYIWGMCVLLLSYGLKIHLITNTVPKLT